jgi:hypothetical protein
MNEDKLKALLQQDMNLRDAIRQEEAERPQMPADLNARLMQRVAQEKKQKRTRMVWPWIAAACVAGIMVVFLTPPKQKIEEKEIVAKVEKKEEKKVEKQQESKPEAPVKAEPKATPATPAKRQQQPRKPVAPTTAPKQLIAQEAAPVEPVDNKQVAVINEPTAKSQELTASTKMQTLTERDIPITRPENYKYTPEEIALMKRQANEAYLKWVELELEIAKHSQEQTAQQ